MNIYKFLLKSAVTYKKSYTDDGLSGLASIYYTLGSQPGKGNWPWWMGGIGLLLLALAGYYFYRRREE